MIAEQHSDGGINNLRGDAIALLVRHPRVRIPSSAMHLLELHAADRELAWPTLPAAASKSHRHRTLHAVDHEHVAHFRIANHVRRAIAEFAIASIDVSAGRLRDV